MGATTLYLYDFEGNLIAETDSLGKVLAEYLYRGRVRLAKVVNGSIYYYHNDQLGTPEFLTNAAGTVVWEAIYKPFGDAEVKPGSTQTNHFRFQGQYFDSETGLHYNHHRYYDPKTGRYLTPDPIGLAGGINPYIYVSNDPVNVVDPLGLQVSRMMEPLGGGGGGLVGGGAGVLGRIGGGGSVLGPKGPGQFIMQGRGVCEHSTVIRRGEFVNRMYDSNFGNVPNVSGPLGRSFTPGSGVPTTAAEGIEQRGLNIYSPNNAQEAIIYRAMDNIPATSRMSIGGTIPEVIIEPQYWNSLNPVCQYLVIP